MHFFYLLAAFLLVNRIYKSLKPSPLSAKWKTFASFSQWGIVVIYITLESAFNDTISTLLSSVVLLGIVIFVGKEEDFKNSRPFIQAHYPLIAVGFITGIAKLVALNFVEDYDNYFTIAVVAAFIYIFGRWATSKKQTEELRIFSEKNTELDRLVAERTAELTIQKNELETALTQLQTTQQQLIQSEKLASLGELTAGIAHEIQNPLNFVNNFSEVSIELIEEMEEELAKGDKEEAIAIASDIKQNLEKIIHHGKRADGIVKGMLQHSRASNSVKEPTDINKLADEYLRLAYHGLRAKDKSFNAELITHFEDKLPALNVVPQDIGRVLLNLFTNAFYATQQKQKISGTDYKPVITVTTLLTKGFVQIQVKDNGSGIPENIKEKIMQPFFTTKPTGEGTGLGLSLSYDIVVKSHNGKIDIDSKEGEFTQFKISIPL